MLYILRNKAGKSAWLLRHVGLEVDGPPSCTFRERPPYPPTQPPAATPALREEELPELMQFFRTDALSREHTAFHVAVMDRFIARETQVLAKHGYGYVLIFFDIILCMYHHLKLTYRSIFLTLSTRCALCVCSPNFN